MASRRRIKVGWPVVAPLSVDAAALTLAGQSVTLTYTPPASEGNPLYVSTTGDDSRTKAQARSASTPWATIHRAVKGSATAGATNAGEAAAAGDTVLVSPGIYNETGVTGDRFGVILNPVNNGTAGNPITIKGNGGRPEIRMANGVRGPTIGANGRAYIVWDSLTINDYYLGSLSDTGPVSFNSSNNCQIINSEISGHTGSYFWGYSTFADNYRLVSIEDGSYITVANNKISRALIGSSPGGQNEGAILTYSAGNCLFEKNTIWNCGDGIFIKGVKTVLQENNVVRYNRIYDCNFSGIRVLDANGAGNNRIYQNIIHNCGTECGALYAGWGDALNSKFFNNTVYVGGRGIVVNDVAGVFFYNNIVANSPSAHYDFTGAPSGIDCFYDRTLYYSNTFIWQSEGGGNQTTLAGWQGLSATKCDPNGASGNPLFVAPASQDFHLQAGSPALTLGRDYYGLTAGGTSSTVIPAGAYITGSEQIGADW